MRTLSNNQPKGLSRHSIRLWGTLFLIAGAVGHAIIMNGLLGMEGMSSEEFGAMLGSDSQNLTLGVAAFVLQLLSACAIPIFTFLLVDGFQRTSIVKNYVLRIAGVALLSEIPYNLAVSGVWFDLNTRNPMVAMTLAAAMLFFYQYYSGKAVKNVLNRAMVLVLGVVWVAMLRIDHGVAIVGMTTTLWALRKNHSLQVFLGCAMMFVLSAFPSFSPTYWLAPIVFLTVHFYNEEQGDENRLVNYLSYPVILLVCGLISKYAM